MPPVEQRTHATVTDLALAAQIAGATAPLVLRIAGDPATYPAVSVEVDHLGRLVVLVASDLRDTIAEQVRADIRRALGL